MKKYRVMIELDTFEITVSAINKAEAKDISTMIRRGWPNNKKEIGIDEE